MKKILSDPFRYVDEMLGGLCQAHPDLYRRTGEGGRAVARADGTRESKVGVVSGGGSGHVSVFTGYLPPRPSPAAWPGRRPRNSSYVCAGRSDSSPGSG